VLTSFWQGVSGKLAERWAALSVPALVVWVLGVVLWATTHGGWARLGSLLQGLDRLSTLAQVAVVVMVLAVVAASAMLVERFTDPVLRLLEGWGWTRVGIRRRAQKVEQRDNRRGELLAQRDVAKLSVAEHQELRRLDAWLYRRPPEYAEVMPTWFGNILKTSEIRPAYKYGLDAVGVWPHLWFVLPENARTEMTNARSAVGRAGAGIIWTTATLVFTIWWPWMPLLSIVALVAAYYLWLIPRARVFADLTEAAFDLYRWQLYKAAHWPPPKNPAEEPAIGKALTQYLLLGNPVAEPTFEA
jgi:hypothetical protein